MFCSTLYTQSVRNILSSAMRALERDHSISNRFSEWRRQLMQACGMPFTSDACRCDLRGSDCKSYGTNKDRHVFSRTSNMKNSSTILNVIFVWALPGLALCSRYNARIHALNKMIGVNSSSTRTDSSLLVVLGLMDSIHLYPVSIDHLARYCSTNASAPAISPRLNPHTTSIETLVANAWITFLPFLSSLFKMISVNFSGSLPASPEVRMCCDTASLLPASNSLVAFLMPFVRVAGIRNCIFLDLSVPITPVEKNSLSTVSTPIRIPFFVHPSMSFEIVSERESILLTSVTPRKALEPSTVQLMVARQLKWYVPLLNFEAMMLSMLYVLSYLGMVCLSIATSRHPEHAVPFHPHYCTVSHLETTSQHIVMPNLFYHAKHPLAARDALALVLCILYESGVVRSLCILAVPAHVKESDQKIAVAVQRVVSVGELKI